MACLEDHFKSDAKLCIKACFYWRGKTHSYTKYPKVVFESYSLKDCKKKMIQLNKKISKSLIKDQIYYKIDILNY